jgi:hypothetical protein
MLGQLGLVTSEQMLSQWRYVVVGSTIVAAVLTPSTDPFTQVSQHSLEVGFRTLYLQHLFLAKTPGHQLGWALRTQMLTHPMAACHCCTAAAMDLHAQQPLPHTPHYD